MRAQRMALGKASWTLKINRYTFLANVFAYGLKSRVVGGDELVKEKNLKY